MYDETSFYAVNKLIDFAKSDAIQKQMTESMNEALAGMCIPGVENPMEQMREQVPQEAKAEESAEEMPHEN
jgi:hypothetical protein